MVYNNGGDADIIINDVRVPKDGLTRFTYYEALGWSGKGAGYAGIQDHPKARNFIFSIWDHKQHTAPIRAVYHGPGTETKPFGGEGTGLKSWNFEIGWKTDVWYTLVARNWDVGDHTHYAFWACAGDTGKWTHLVTMDVAAPQARFRGSNDSFLEDWVNSGKNKRTSHIRKGWRRKTDGSWLAATEARYSVNKWDLAEGKRSYNFRDSWNGGVGKDDTGQFYFMTAGGDTKPTTTNPAKFAIPRTAEKPEFEPLKIGSATAVRDGNTLTVKWENDPATLPQFSYVVDVYTNAAGKGEPLASVSQELAHARSATLDVSFKKFRSHYVRLRCTDILDGESQPLIVKVTKAK
jgi:hypothetical protein